jgi:hypothetical protein
MTDNAKTYIIGALVLALLILSYWGIMQENKRNYNIAQKFISIQTCKHPYYNGVGVKYLKQTYKNGTVELGFENGDKLTLTQDQVMNILCK